MSRKKQKSKSHEEKGGSPLETENRRSACFFPDYRMSTIGKFSSDSCHLIPLFASCF